jgi:hypothetical protein
MKPSSIFYTSVAALAVSALTVDGALASINLNSSRSNIYRLKPNDLNAPKACTDAGGTVSTDKDGNRICTMPKGKALPAGIAVSDEGAPSDKSDKAK